MWVSWPGATFPSFVSKQNKLRALAPRLLDIGARLRRALNAFKAGQPDEDFVVWAELRACYHSLEKQGVPVPWQAFFRGSRALWYFQNATYCEGVGALLKDGHIAEAMRCASGVQENFIYEDSKPEASSGSKPSTDVDADKPQQD